MDLSRTVGIINVDELKAWILSTVKQLNLDLGGNMDEHSELNICRRIKETMLSGEKKQWRLDEFATIIDSGVRSQFEVKPRSKLTVVTWYSWVEEYGKRRARRHIEASLYEQKAAHNTTATMMHGTGGSLDSRVFFAAFKYRQMFTHIGAGIDDNFKDLKQIYTDYGEDGIREYYRNLTTSQNTAYEQAQTA